MRSLGTPPIVLAIVEGYEPCVCSLYGAVLSRVSTIWGVHYLALHSADNLTMLVEILDSYPCQPLAVFRRDTRSFQLCSEVSRNPRFVLTELSAESCTKEDISKRRRLS